MDGMWCWMEKSSRILCAQRVGWIKGPLSEKDTVAADENWDDRFVGPPGVDGEVSVIAVNGNDVYVGGWFSNIRGLPVNNIAKWDGSNWSALGSGVTGDVTSGVGAIAVNGNVVYAGGSFERAGGIAALNVAKWDGNNWSAIGNGVQGDVHAIAVSGSDLYVGGDFSEAGGGTTANNIAKWDGSRWSALGSGVYGITTRYQYPYVDALAFARGELYAGGKFTSAGDVSANNIAEWDGTKWSALGNGLTYPTETGLERVNAIAIVGGAVYVGGAFINAGGVNANNIARWDGTKWSTLGVGFDPYVSAITSMNGKVVVGAYFAPDPQHALTDVFSWDGTTWTALGGNFQYTNQYGPYFTSIGVTSSGNLFIGGVFSVAGGVEVNNIAEWNQSHWAGLGTRLSNSVSAPPEAVVAFANQSLIGGDFVEAGSVAREESRIGMEAVTGKR